MQSEMWCRVVQDIISQLELICKQQADLDNFYDKMCKAVFTELDKQWEYKSASVKMRKKLKFSRPYWSDELNVLWKDMKMSEKQFAKCKDGQDAQRVLLLKSITL